MRLSWFLLSVGCFAACRFAVSQVAERCKGSDFVRLCGVCRAFFCEYIVLRAFRVLCRFFQTVVPFSRLLCRISYVLCRFFYVLCGKSYVLHRNSGIPYKSSGIPQKTFPHTVPEVRRASPHLFRGTRQRAQGDGAARKRFRQIRSPIRRQRQKSAVSLCASAQFP